MAKEMMREKMEKVEMMAHPMKHAMGKMARLGKGKSGGKMKPHKGKY